MDEADAQRSYATGTDYEFRQEQREMTRMDPTKEPPAKRSKGISHNKTKVQQAKVSNQLLIRAAEFDQKTHLLLAESNHGIPSLTEIKLNGRRVQDNANLASQIATERQVQQI